MSRILLREIETLAEYGAVQAIAQEVWRFEPRQVPSTFDLQVAGHVGGLTAGAFEGRTLVGFVHGLPRTNLDEPCHHSHMLAVRRAWRGRGLSVRLKLFQRSWCLGRGIRLVTWTFDPLLTKNAHLNLVRLRARATCYLPNLYGPLGGLYGGLPTDRFEVHWRLASTEVVRAARGAFPEASDAARLPVAVAGRRQSAARLAVPIPVDAASARAGEVAAARRRQRRFGRLARELFEKGFEAVSVSLSEDRPVYVFERS